VTRNAAACQEARNSNRPTTETPVPTLLDLNGGVGLVGVDPGLLSAGIFCALAFSQDCE
jgi:hypothetical protein